MENAILRISVRSSRAMFGSYGTALSTMSFASRTALTRSGLTGGRLPGVGTLILWPLVNLWCPSGYPRAAEVPIPDQGLGAGARVRLYGQVSERVSHMRFALGLVVFLVVALVVGWVFWSAREHGNSLLSVGC